MTHPTKAVYKFIMQDFLRMRYARHPTLRTILNFHSQLWLNRFSVHSPRFQHVFCFYHNRLCAPADITLSWLLFHTVPCRTRPRRVHVVKAEIPPVRPDILVVESTYGVQSHEGRVEKEDRFTSLVHSIIKGGGHVLLPSFALGRAQELLLILEEYWSQHSDLHSVPIYYVSSLAKKCMAVYQTYIHTMNSNIRGRFAKQDNPFSFK